MKLFLCQLLALSAPQLARALEAHVHGQVHLTIALENSTSGTVRLEGPAESFMSFEHKAKTQEEKAEEAQMRRTLSAVDRPWLVFAPEKQCLLTRRSLDFTQHGEHGEIVAEFSLTCRQALSDSQAKVILGRIFPHIRALDVQILKDSGQTGSKIEAGVGSIIF